MGKKWYSSKTIRFSGILAALGVAILTLPQFDLLVAEIPTEYAGVAGIIISLITAYLRSVTSTAVTIGNK